jgi:hypothetical protein
MEIHIAPLFLKLTTILALLFTACIGFIHARPPDDADVRALLASPDDCPMPCFIGIRPGATTADEALAILEAHAWIGDVELAYNRVTGAPNAAIWNWSGSQPQLIQDTLYGSPYRGNLRIENGLVTAIWIPTTITAGDLWLLWGKPDEFAFTLFRQPSEDDQPLFLSYFEIFAGQRAVSQTFVYCPYFPVDWNATVAITLGDASDVAFISERATTNRFPDIIVDLHEKYC